MAVYLIRRVALALVVLFGLLVATFLIIHLVPGDPVQLVLGVHATPQAEAGVRHQLFLDRPWPAQFWLYVSHMVQGKFGEAFSLNASVASVIGQRLGPSAALITYSFIVALVVGVPLAILAALRPNGLLDNALRLGTTFVFAMPAFWLGLMLALIFGLELGWFPVSGYQGGIGGLLKTLTLPALTLGLPLATIVVRTLRSSLLEVMTNDYIRTARAKGLPTRLVVWRHALKNAAIPFIAFFAIQVTFMFGNTVIAESMFAYPGMSRLAVEAIATRDMPVIQVFVLLAGTLVVCVNILADLLYAWLDPRIRYQ